MFVSPPTFRYSTRSVLASLPTLALRGGMRGARAVQRADQRERGEIHALGAQAGVLHGAQHALDHLALGGDDDHALARPVGSIEHAERVVVQHRRGQRHRHLILGLEAHRGAELLAVGDRRQLQRAQHRALVGQPHAHALAQSRVLEELAQRLAQLALVEHLALAHDVGRQRSAGGPFDDDPAVDVRLHGGHVPGLDIQPDDAPTPAAEGEVQVEVGLQSAERRHWQGRHRRLRAHR